jgi:hypothetical protein
MKNICPDFFRSNIFVALTRYPVSYQHTSTRIIKSFFAEIIGIFDGIGAFLYLWNFVYWQRYINFPYRVIEAFEEFVSFIVLVTCILCSWND